MDPSRSVQGLRGVLLVDLGILGLVGVDGDRLVASRGKLRAFAFQAGLSAVKTKRTENVISSSRVTKIRTSAVEADFGREEMSTVCLPSKVSTTGRMKNGNLESV